LLSEGNTPIKPLLSQTMQVVATQGDYIRF